MSSKLDFYSCPGSDTLQEKILKPQVDAFLSIDTIFFRWYVSSIYFIWHAGSIWGENWGIALTDQNLTCHIWCATTSKLLSIRESWYASPVDTLLWKSYALNFACLKIMMLIYSQSPILRLVDSESGVIVSKPTEVIFWTKTGHTLPFWYLVLSLKLLSVSC